MGFDIQQIRKVRDPLFRQQVLRAYNYECAICGFNMRHDNASVGLEAAHIKWKQFGGPCEIQNGLALCAIHHKAFDKDRLGWMRVCGCWFRGGEWGRDCWAAVLGFCREADCVADGERNYPKEGYVEWHRKEVFR